MFGQGATGKTRTEAQPILHDGEQAERLLTMFGSESRQSKINWDKGFEEGSDVDVLHFTVVLVLGPGVGSDDK
jgi:hypothetical protein